jgi:flagellar basal-body rod protein FlgF
MAKVAQPAPAARLQDEYRGKASPLGRVEHVFGTTRSFVARVQLQQFALLLLGMAGWHQAHREIFDTASALVIWRSGVLDRGLEARALTGLRQQLLPQAESFSADTRSTERGLEFFGSGTDGKIRSFRTVCVIVITVPAVPARRLHSAEWGPRFGVGGSRSKPRTNGSANCEMMARCISKERAMISGLYSAATAMEVAGRRHEVSAENLANLQMPGFRRRVLPQATFETILAEINPGADGDAVSRTRLGTAAGEVTYDFVPGPLRDTGRPLDMAINGDAFFTVQGLDGPLYTRNGTFHLNEDGQLTTIDGLAVLGRGGPITFPNSISSESIEVSSDGYLSVDGSNAGELSTVRFDRPEFLVSVGASLFSAAPEAGPIDADPTVLQGYLEDTNVSAVQEMVQMIANNRHYEAAQRTMNAISDMMRQRIGL